MKTPTLTATLGTLLFPLSALADDIPCEFGTDHPCSVPEPSSLLLIGGALIVLWTIYQVAKLVRKF